jgi:EAL domain-containing protein (putative c-di-GMP-specific phosphodiesterase class I)
VVLLDAIRDPKDAHRVAERLLEVFSSPFQLGKHTVYSTASIGIVTSDLSDGSAEDLLRDADTAMYEAKLAGRGKYVVFDVSMRKRVQHRLNLESDLRQAIDKRQFHLVYQPIVSLATGEVESLEVLVRWQHPERGTVSPAEFVPVAEENGMIIPIGDWVMRTSFEQMARWQQTLGARSPKGMSVNISRNQLFQPDFVEHVRSLVHETGVDPSQLHFEVTESAIMKDVGCASRTLKALRAMGIRIEMDDFGTGYSSLACLHQFQLDVLKIDRSFIASIDRGRDFAALVHAVAQLARNLNITVVAEGIETLEQALMLQSLNVEFGQGYLFSRPLTAEQVETFEVNRSMLPGQRSRAA